MQYEERKICWCDWLSKRTNKTKLNELQLTCHFGSREKWNSIELTAMNSNFYNTNTMYLQIGSDDHYTSPIANFVTTASAVDEQFKLDVPFNLSSDAPCLQLRNFTDEFIACPPCCEHAPQMTDKIILKVIVLGLMGFFSLIGNAATIWNIRKNRATRRALRHSCSAIYALLFHLSVADIFVTFFCIIGEALWSFTVEWIAGDIACKLVKILQMFALYLSTNVLVLIGIDRWVAVKYPMKSKFLNTARFVVSYWCHEKAHAASSSFSQCTNDDC